MTIPIHQHLLVRAHSFQTTTDESKLKDFLTDLVSEVGMKIATPAQAHYVDDPGNEGLTGTIGLSTSHASIHFFDEVVTPGSKVMFDLYSCAEFDILNTLNFLVRRLNLDQLEYTVVNRDSGFIYDSKMYLGL